MDQDKHAKSLFNLIESVGNKSKSQSSEDHNNPVLLPFCHDIIYHYARKGSVPEVNRLLDESNINSRNVKDNGRTILHEASAYGCSDLVRSLIQHKGLNVNKKTFLGKDTALHLAVRSNHRDVVFVLLNYGYAAVNETNKYGCTPLHYAQDKSIAELLCRYGALITMKDVNQLNAIDRALIQGFTKNSDLVQFLLKAEKISSKKTIQLELKKHRMKKQNLVDKKEKHTEFIENLREKEYKRVTMENYIKWRTNKDPKQTT